MRTTCFTCDGLGSLPALIGAYRVICQFCNGYGATVVGETLLTPGLRGSIPNKIQDEADTQPMETREEKEEEQ
jgi:hypothetical protein